MGPNSGLHSVDRWSTWHSECMDVHNHGTGAGPPRQVPIKLFIPWNMGLWWSPSCIYPLVNKHSYWKWSFIVDLSIIHSDFPISYVSLPGGKTTIFLWFSYEFPIKPPFSYDFPISFLWTFTRGWSLQPAGQVIPGNPDGFPKSQPALWMFPGGRANVWFCLHGLLVGGFKHEWIISHFIHGMSSDNHWRTPSFFKMVFLTPN